MFSRSAQEKVAAEQQIALKGAQKVKRESKEALKRAETCDAEYKAAERSLIEASFGARKGGKFFVPAGAKVAFVIHVEGISAMPPKEKKILRLLRLRQIQNGVFLKLNYAAIAWYSAWNRISRTDART